MSFPRYQEYKDSGVGWLGEVPNDWELKRLRYVTTLLTDKSEECENAIGLENIEGWTGRFISTDTEFERVGVDFEAGDILFGKLRPYLAKVWLAEFAGKAVGDFHVMRPSPDICGRYVIYQMLNRDFISIVDGSTFGARMPRVSWDFMANMLLPVPTPHEQHAIVSFLDRETSKIDSLAAEERRLIELPKEKRQAVISHAVTKGQNPNASMKPSGIQWLGDVPEHWSPMKIKYLFQYAKRQNYPDETVLSVYRDYGVIEKSTRDDNFHKTPVDLTAYQLVESGDLVINKMKAWQGSLGISKLRGITSPDYVVYRSINAEYLPYLHQLLRSKQMASLYHSLSNGVRPAQWRVETDKFEQIILYLPPLGEQEDISQFIESQLKEFDNLSTEAERAIELLQERRTALISAAVTGKIDVRQFAYQETA